MQRMEGNKHFFNFAVAQREYAACSGSHSKLATEGGGYSLTFDRKGVF